jgi:hypothetical protein
MNERMDIDTLETQESVCICACMRMTVYTQSMSPYETHYNGLFYNHGFKLIIQIIFTVTKNFG